MRGMDECVVAQEEKRRFVFGTRLGRPATASAAAASASASSLRLDASRVNLSDSPDVIARKIKKCKTDQFPGIEWDNPDRPECTNLLNIYQIVTGLDRDAIADEVADLRWGDFKPRLADAVVAHLEPIQSKYAELKEDKLYLTDTLKKGADQADEIATKTLDDAKAAMGITTRASL